jgi:hypothetical protein
MRDLGAAAIGDLPDRLAGLRLDLVAVEEEGDGVANGSSLRR